MAPRLVYWVDGRQIVFPLDKDAVSLGRDHRNDIVIERPSVSRRHARVLRQAPGVWNVVDAGSAYGTRLNERRITEAALSDGDTIHLHDFPLTFHDKTAPRASLTGSSGDSAEIRGDTVFQNTVNFSGLASVSADVTHLQRLMTIVTRASEAILAGPALDDTFHAVLDLVFEHLPVQRGFIMLWDDARKDFVTPCVKLQGLQSSELEIQFSRTIAEKVVQEGVGVLTTDAQSDGRFAAGASVVRLGIRSAMAAPLWSGDKVDGLIYVDTPLQTRAFDRFDLDLLSALGNQVAMAIGHARLQESVVEQQIVRRRLERYHSPAVIDRITAGSSSDALAVDERDVTVLFADVVDFTKRCEQLEPRQIAAVLNRYFGEMTESVFHHEGTLDKFIGDCLMAVFGAPIPTEDHATRAVEAALDMRQALARLNEPLVEEERVVFRVGIHSGRVVAGDIGSPSRTDYTVLGSTVNLAARLESSVAGPGQIVISGATLNAIGDKFQTRSLGEHRPKGISRAVACFELLGRVD